MDFEVKVWRNIYDQVNILGQYLKDSRPDFYGNPPKFTITLDERIRVEGEIEDLLKNSSRYLDKCKILPKPKKWHYDKTNETTWHSSENFKYSHLMPRKKYVKVGF